jgi:hypothetical protein
MKIVLKAAGSDLTHIVKANIYLTNMSRDFAPMNEVYREARTTAKQAHDIDVDLSAHSSSLLIHQRGRALGWLHFRSAPASRLSALQRSRSNSRVQELMYKLSVLVMSIMNDCKGPGDSRACHGLPSLLLV